MIFRLVAASLLAAFAIASAYDAIAHPQHQNARSATITFNNLSVANCRPPIDVQALRCKPIGSTKQRNTVHLDLLSAGIVLRIDAKPLPSEFTCTTDARPFNIVNPTTNSRTSGRCRTAYQGNNFVEIAIEADLETENGELSKYYLYVYFIWDGSDCGGYQTVEFHDQTILATFLETSCSLNRS